MMGKQISLWSIRRSGQTLVDLVLARPKRCMRIWSRPVTLHPCERAFQCTMNRRRPLVAGLRGC